MPCMKLYTILWAVLAFATAIIEAGPVHARQGPSPIPNGDFENGTYDGWMLTGGSKAVTIGPEPTFVSPGSNSSKALQLQCWVNGLIGLVEQPLQQATNYSISVDYKIINASDSCIFILEADDGDIHTYNWNTSAKPMDGWATAQIFYPNFVSQQFGMQAGIECANDGDSALFQVDNIKMEPIGSTIPASCEGEAELGNGDFETGQLAPWYAQEPFEGDANGRTGKWGSPGHNSAHALEVDFAAGATMAAWNFRQTIHNVCFTQTYRYGFAVNWLNYTGPPTGDGSCHLEVQAFDCDTDDQVHKIPPKLDGWTEYVYNCQAKRDAMDISVILDCGLNVTNAVAVQLDSFTLQRIGAGSSPTPTPTATGTPTPTAISRRRRIRA